METHLETLPDHTFKARVRLPEFVAFRPELRDLYLLWVPTSVFVSSTGCAEVRTDRLMDRVHDLPEHELDSRAAGGLDGGDRRRRKGRSHGVEVEMVVERG